MLTAIKRILKMCGHAFTITVHERLEAIEQRNAETDNALLQASIRMAERIPAAANIVAVETPELASSQWISLIVYLYSHIPSRRAALIGPTASGLAAVLDKAGFETTVCESCAVVPEDLGVLVIDRSVQAEPLLKEQQPPVVVSQAGDGFPQTVEQMRKSAYYWYLVTYDDRANSGGSFFANCAIQVPGDEGHAFFFRSRETFAEAQSWCAALLRKTLFRYTPQGSA